MTITRISKICSISLLLMVAMTIQTVAQNREYYQLKTYIFDSEEQVEITDKYLKDSYLPALKKLKITNVGVFKPLPTDTVRKIVILIPFSSLDQFQSLDDELSKNKSYLKSGESYLNASYDNPPYRRIESMILRAFKDMPVMQPSGLNGSRQERVYELRSYESATESYFKNKVDMFNAGGEVKLFDKLGFNAVFYAEVISGAKMPNLMYMTTFSDKESQEEHWKSFMSAPEWAVLKVQAKYQKNVSHIDKYFLYPTEYSDY
jgi:hypothetical protein